MIGTTSTRIEATEVHERLAAAKTSVPHLRSGIVRRQRLSSRLAASADLPLVVVSAPVEYGKTTLLVDWVRTTIARSRGCRWILPTTASRR